MTVQAPVQLMEAMEALVDLIELKHRVKMSNASSIFLRLGMMVRKLRMRDQEELVEMISRKMEDRAEVLSGRTHLEPQPWNNLALKLMVRVED